MQTVLVTGVGKGIGRALAQKFLSEDYFVIGTYHSAKQDYTHANLVTFPLDLTQAESIDACAQAVKDLGKEIDIHINNAGVLLDEDETQVVIEKLRDTLEVNLIGTIAFTETVLPLIKKSGHIINISSTAGSLGLPLTHDHSPYHYPAYKISKTALNMYTRTLSGRLHDEGIVVSSVHPGWVKTDMGGADAEITPEEAAKGIFALAVSRPKTGQFWFKGENLPW